VADPVLHLIVGPNGSGKSTLYDRVIGPATHLRFVNADDIAADCWPDAPGEHSTDAAEIAQRAREALLEERRSFATETVFSHPSRLEFVRRAVGVGYLVTIHVLLVPEALAVARVANRVELAGHDIPEAKIRARYARLWPLVVDAIAIAESAFAYDNSSAAKPFRLVSSYQRGRVVGTPRWPSWAPAELCAGDDPAVAPRA
jgi:predicted ABC-type ATPase